MDISFKTEAGRFNGRVCGVIVHNGRLLVMQDGACPYFYLPGGRIQLHETAEQAMHREMQEEMGFQLPILRPLWLCQAYFTEEVSGERFHEIGFYFLLDASSLDKQDFIHNENGRLNRFHWADFDALPEMYLYPEFIKEKIHSLPEHLEIIIENRI